MAIVKRKEIPLGAQPVIDYKEPFNIVPGEKKPLPAPDYVEGSSAEGSVVRRMGWQHMPFNVTDKLKAVRTAYNPDDLIEQKYRGRIKNRGTAITAKCVDCQGGSRKRVTECMAIECPLWAFRHGGDPLRGR